MLSVALVVAPWVGSACPSDATYSPSLSSLYIRDALPAPPPVSRLIRARWSGIPVVSPPRNALALTNKGGEAPDTTTEWFSFPLERSISLPLDHLHYPWLRKSRLGVTVSELVACRSLRLDLALVVRICEAGFADEAKLSLGRFMAEGDGVSYQVLPKIPGDRTITFSVNEVLFLDRYHVFCKVLTWVGRSISSCRRSLPSVFRPDRTSPLSLLMRYRSLHHQ